MISPKVTEIRHFLIYNICIHVRGSPKNKFTTHKTNIHMVTFNNRDSTLFYNTVPTKTEAFVQSWDWFVNSCLVEFCALRFQPSRNSCFHVVICKSVARKMILKSGKKVKITRCEIWDVWQMFQNCPPGAL